MALRVGDPAPTFTAQTHTGETVRLEDLRGKNVVLYFYPRDGTSFCTAQACALRDSQQQLQDMGVVVLGVSAQGQASHASFATRHRLNFPILIDPDCRIAIAYDAAGMNWLSARFRRAFGVYRRVTYIIDPTGHISHIIDDPNCRDHGEQVLSLLRAARPS